MILEFSFTEHLCMDVNIMFFTGKYKQIDSHMYQKVINIWSAEKKGWLVFLIFWGLFFSSSEHYIINILKMMLNNHWNINKVNHPIASIERIFKYVFEIVWWTNFLVNVHFYCFMQTLPKGFNSSIPLYYKQFSLQLVQNEYFVFMHLAIIKLSINCNLLFCLSISNWSANIHNPEMH